jgi:hypothetical protein
VHSRHESTLLASIANPHADAFRVTSDKLTMGITSPLWGLGWQVRARRAFTVRRLVARALLELAVFLGKTAALLLAAATVASPVDS